MFFLVAVALLLVLPSPWNVFGFVGGLVVFGGEVVYWNRTVRRRRVQAGAETLIGRTATVVTACRPDGQVRLDGEIWGARCDEGADAGETVVVTGRSRLALVVARHAAAS